MSHRYARSNDILRSLYKRTDFPIIDLKITYEGVHKLGTGEVLLSGPLSILCGENGVGKSTLLKLIKNTLLEKPIQPTTSKAQFSLSIKEGQETISIQSSSGLIEYFEQHENSDVKFFDPSTDIPIFLAEIAKDTQFEDLLNGIDPIVLPSDELDNIRQIIGKPYDKIEIYEIEEIYGFKQFPYFKAILGTTEYTPLDMGLGEFSLLYLIWLIRQSPKSSILLIEEPESFIPPRSQRQLLDWLAEKCSERKHFIVLSTHSGQIAGRIPRTHLQYCSRDASGVSLLPNPASRLLIERLAILSHRRCLVFVEDEAAKYLAKNIIKHFDDRLEQECVFSIARSNSNITNALNAIPYFKSNALKIFGIYDGDQRSTIDPKTFFWPIHFLPSSDPPEFLIQETIGSISLEYLSSTLCQSIPAIRTALSDTGARNHHDWLNELIKTLDIHLDQFIAIITPKLIEKHHSECKKFVEDLHNSSIN